MISYRRTKRYHFLLFATRIVCNSFRESKLLVSIFATFYFITKLCVMRAISQVFSLSIWDNFTLRDGLKESQCFHSFTSKRIIINNPELHVINAKTKLTKLISLWEFVVAQIRTSNICQKCFSHYLTAE